MANTENVGKWVAALRSGEYEKTSGSLRRDGCFCALGVACDVSGAGAWSGNEYKTRGDRSFCRLPFEVAEWLGFSEEETDPEADTGLEYDNGIFVRVSALNDYREFSFAEIADALERTYLSGPS